MGQARIVFDHRQIFDHPLTVVMREGFDVEPVYSTQKGALFEGDCLDILPHIESETIDTVFADPPFNLKKSYGENVNDNLTPEQYLLWCRQWIHQC
ncbi:MAG: site-specific DNA-methyltransferase, partial [Deltaproteobacteria bacterium]|nr:site-specific DNA-methyltransferase [Deltaproteobacteria bacterium]